MALISNNQTQSIAIYYSNSIAREMFAWSELYQENISRYGISDYKDFAEYIECQRWIDPNELDEEHEELFAVAVEDWNDVITKAAEEYFNETKKYN